MWCGMSNIYAVVAEYFGRGLFNKLTVVDEAGESATSPAPALAPAPAPAAAPAPAPAPAATYGPGAEAKLRLQEGQSKQVYVASTSNQAPKGTPVIPIAEGKMRLLEQQQYGSSLEANMNRLEPKVHHQRNSPLASPRNRIGPSSVSNSPNISSAISNATKNPFEEPNYDEAKNPFAGEEANEPTNPFGEDEDYDKNLNPFS